MGTISPLPLHKLPLLSALHRLSSQGYRSWRKAQKYIDTRRDGQELNEAFPYKSFTLENRICYHPLMQGFAWRKTFDLETRI